MAREQVKTNVQRARDYAKANKMSYAQLHALMERATAADGHVGKKAPAELLPELTTAEQSAVDAAISELGL